MKFCITNETIIGKISLVKKFVTGTKNATYLYKDDSYYRTN